MVTVLPAANYAYDVVSNYAIRSLNDALEEKIYGRKKPKFYYRRDNRTFFKVLVDSALQYVSTELKNTAFNMLKEKLKKKKKDDFVNNALSSRRNHMITLGSDQTKQYGKMPVVDVNGKIHNVLCRDCFNNPCPDGLMLKIPSKKPIQYWYYEGETTITNQYAKTDFHSRNIFKANALVWYDATAMIDFTSSKNLVITAVAGRDYSRKELASNGDITFTVNGHILSNMADVLPEETLAKFIQVMQYKGLVEVDNVLLNQHHITKILIKDFKWAPEEGSKSKITYSFSGIGIQPASEVEVAEDTLYLDTIINKTTTQADDSWSKWFKAKLEGTAYSALETADTAISSAINNIHI